MDFSLAARSKMPHGHRDAAAEDGGFSEKIVHVIDLLCDRARWCVRKTVRG